MRHGETRWSAEGLGIEPKLPSSGRHRLSKPSHYRSGSPPRTTGCVPGTLGRRSGEVAPLPRFQHGAFGGSGISPNLAGELGLEPGFRGPEPRVLPLNYSPELVSLAGGAGFEPAEPLVRRFGPFQGGCDKPGSATLPIHAGADHVRDLRPREPGRHRYLADRGRFELPRDGFAAPTRFPGARLRPLGHLSLRGDVTPSPRNAKSGWRSRIRTWAARFRVGSSTAKLTSNGGWRGIRTLEALLGPTPLAGERLRPLGQPPIL